MANPYSLFRTKFLAMGLICGLAISQRMASCSEPQPLLTQVVGMYVHQHWPYKHPYAARTWTLDDWRGYADGLKKLGFNTIMIWPMLETMPNPLTPSDRASLEKHRQVIDILHHEFGMRVLIVLSPNVAASKAAENATFETRHFYLTDVLVNPADRAAVDAMMRWREHLFAYLKAADGLAVIDSDPGGFPGSSNAEFVSLLELHRKMLDRLRPGIELDYWVHMSWHAWSQFDATGILEKGKEADYLDTLSRLKTVDPEPWGLANGLPYAQKLGLASRVISFNYGRIEAEPSLPMTNFGGTAAYDGGSDPGPRGVMGNAQTHCAQLPNTFAFVRGALKRPVTDADYVQFGNRLIQGQGHLIVDSWKALVGSNPELMRSQVTRIQQVRGQDLRPSDLKGLLFGSPERFLSDVVLQLQLRAAYEEFAKATNGVGNVKTALSAFVTAAQAWDNQTGYQGHWSWPGLYDALGKLHSPAIDKVLKVNICLFRCADSAHPSGYKDVEIYFANQETFTPRLIAAMKETLSQMR